MCRDAIDAYRENNDWLASFLEDCCEVDKTYQQKSGEFYQEFIGHIADVPVSTLEAPLISMLH